MAGRGDECKSDWIVVFFLYICEFMCIKKQPQSKSLFY